MQTTPCLNSHPRLHPLSLLHITTAANHTCQNGCGHRSPMQRHDCEGGHHLHRHALLLRGVRPDGGEEVLQGAAAGEGQRKRLLVTVCGAVAGKCTASSSSTCDYACTCACTCGGLCLPARVAHLPHVRPVSVDRRDLALVGGKDDEAVRRAGAVATQLGQRQQHGRHQLHKGEGPGGGGRWQWRRRVESESERRAAQAAMQAQEHARLHVLDTSMGTSCEQCAT